MVRGSNLKRPGSRGGYLLAFEDLLNKLNIE
jgi:hypothetical protein